MPNKFTDAEYEKALKKQKKEQKALHESWASDPVLQGADALRLQTQSAREEVRQRIEAAEQRGAPLGQRTALRRRLENDEKIADSLEKLEADLQNLLTVTRPTGGMQEFHRISDSKFRQEYLKILRGAGKMASPADVHPEVKNVVEKAVNNINDERKRVALKKGTKKR